MTFSKNVRTKVVANVEYKMNAVYTDKSEHPTYCISRWENGKKIDYVVQNVGKDTIEMVWQDTVEKML